MSSHFDELRALTIHFLSHVGAYGTPVVGAPPSKKKNTVTADVVHSNAGLAWMTTVFLVTGILKIAQECTFV